MAEALTQRGQKKLCFEGYRYTINLSRGSTTYWQCEERDCGGRAIEKPGVLRCSKEHCHPPDAVATEVRKRCISFLSIKVCTHLFFVLVGVLRCLSCQGICFDARRNICYHKPCRSQHRPECSCLYAIKGSAETSDTTQASGALSPHPSRARGDSATTRMAVHKVWLPMGSCRC